MILWWLAGIALSCAMFLTYCLCAVSGKCSRLEDSM